MMKKVIRRSETRTEDNGNSKTKDNRPQVKIKCTR